MTGCAGIRTIDDDTQGHTRDTERVDVMDMASCSKMDFGVR